MYFIFVDYFLYFEEKLSRLTHFYWYFSGLIWAFKLTVTFFFATDMYVSLLHTKHSAAKSSNETL